MKVELIRRDLGDGNANGVFLRTVEISSPACTLQTDMMGLGELHVVDNERYSYSIKVSGLKPGYVLHGVRLTYRTDDLTPCYVCQPERRASAVACSSEQLASLSRSARSSALSRSFFSRVGASRSGTSFYTPSRGPIVGAGAW